jgi:hypothetical protein
MRLLLLLLVMMKKKLIRPVLSAFEHPTNVVAVAVSISCDIDHFH